MGKNGTLRGQVKWFDTAKGFGFVVVDGCKSDILLHANVLRSFGRNSITAASKVEITVQETDRGCQAVEIISIDSPVAAISLELVREILGEGVDADPDAELEPARVKWFDRGKGFGFVNVFGKHEDIFVHMEVLHACGLSELQPGEAVGVRLANGQRGRMAWDIRVWDQAVIEKG